MRAEVGRKNGFARGWIAKVMAVVVLLGVFITIGEDPSAAAPALPAGFSRVPIPTGFDQYELVNFVFLPSGEILAAGKCGDLRRVTLAGSSTPLPSIPTYCEGDRGLLGIDLAPDFETSRHVYTLYTYRRADNRAWARLTRWTANDADRPTALTNEVVLLDDMPSFSSTGATCDDSHTIGTVLAAPDGTLYVGNGDGSSYCSVDTSALASYDPGSPRGKILHINPDGSGVATNPYFQPASPSSWQSRVFATGVRNPFRFTLRPGTDALYVGDVGWTEYEEISVAQPTGANLGWPCWEGPADFRNGYASLSGCGSAYGTMTPVAPIHSWSHAGTDAAAVGGEFYTGDTYPADYRGALFFADYGKARIWTMRTDAEHRVVRQPESGGFATDIGAPVAFRAGPNGDIFYADLLSGNIFRIRYTPGNRAPVAQIVVDRTAGGAPLTVRFDAVESYDLDGESLTYSWTFGDGGTSTAISPSHTYANVGSFTASLTVRDQLGATNTTTILITPGNNPPSLSVRTPPSGTTFAVGDTLDLPATATDVEDGVLPPGSISFSTVQRHCPYGGSCHAHPGPVVGEQQDPGRIVCVINDHGDDSYLEVKVTARDSAGATTSQIVKVEPKYRTLGIAPSMAGVPIAVNASNTLSYDSFKLVVGSQNSISAPASYQDKVFLRWADGGPRERTFVMPSTDTTLTAIYTRRPVAVAVATPTSGRAPLAVSFSSVGSNDPDGTAVTYAWSFGDGSPSSVEPNPTHVYSSSGSYTATVTVKDGDGASAQASVPVVVSPTPAGLVGGYGFEETSGATVSDASGRGNGGTINAGVSRTQAGHTGAALSFNGSNGAVTVPDADSLDLTSGFTVSAWIRPTVATGWRTVVMKERPAGFSYALYGGDGTGRAAGYASLGGSDRDATAPTALVANTWSHVTATYDGSAVRTFVNGTLVATTTTGGTMQVSTGALKIGGNAVWSEWFSGLIDDVRVYNRALSATEVAFDMSTPVAGSASDTQVPSSPTGVGANVSANTVSLTWTASTDNVAVTGYDVHRSTTAGFAPTLANRIATPTTPSHTDAGLAPGTYHYLVVARDGAGNASAPSTAVSATIAGDLSPPTKPGSLVASGAIGRVALTWSASTDDVGVTGYDVHRSTTGGFTPDAGNRVGTVTGTTYSDTGLAAGTYRYRIVARDAALRSSPASDEATAMVAADGPPTVQVTAPASGATVSGSVALAATAGDDVGVAGVQFRIDGGIVGAEDVTAPYTASWSSTGVPNGPHVVTAVARDSNGATTISSGVSVVVANVAAPTGLVAAYGFNEAGGASVSDASGAGNAGTIDGATRSSAGRFGGALSFDGVNDSVSVADSSSLDLTGPLTISAWVRPTTVTGWRTVLMKESGSADLTYALYSSTSNNRPGGYLEIGGADRELKGTASVVTTAWRHLTLTYDGTTMRMYIDGVLRGSRTQSGALSTSTGSLRIGGNAVWGEWFSGLIDEVRVYNRALPAAEIVTVMNTPL